MTIPAFGKRKGTMPFKTNRTVFCIRQSIHKFFMRWQKLQIKWIQEGWMKEGCGNMQIWFVTWIRPICHICELRVVMAQTMAMERSNKRRRRRKWRNSYYSTAEPLVIIACFNHVALVSIICKILIYVMIRWTKSQVIICFIHFSMIWESSLSLNLVDKLGWHDHLHYIHERFQTFYPKEQCTDRSWTAEFDDGRLSTNKRH